MGRESVAHRGLGWVLMALVGAVVLPGCGDRSSEPAVAARHPPPGRVVLIGVDGGSWNVLDPMLRAGDLPHFGELAGRGATADLWTVSPVISPTVWTSIATGQGPDLHGITGFFQTGDQIRVPTIWERLSQRGRRVGLYDYLLTWPPLDLPGGFVIPGWLRRDDSLSPPDVFSRHGMTPYQFTLLLDRPEAALETMQGEVREKAPRFNQLAEAFSLELGAVTFYSLDMVSHRFWHTYQPESFAAVPPVDPMYRTIIPDTLRGIDRAVGEIVGTLGPDDTVVVASDHGFLPRPEIRRRFTFRERLLELGGIDAERDGVRIITQWQSLVLRLDPGPEDEREALLGKLESFFSGLRDAAGAPLFRTQVSHQPPRPEELRAERSPTIAQLLETDASAWAFVVAEHEPEAWQTGWPEGSVEVAGEQVAMSELAQAEDNSGRHGRTGILMAAGPAIRPLEERAELSVIDIAPLLFYLLGEAIPDDFAGRLPVDLLRVDYLEQYPPRRVASEIELPEGGVVPEQRPIEDPEMLQRLRTLGYID